MPQLKPIHLQRLQQMSPKKRERLNRFTGQYATIGNDIYQRHYTNKAQLWTRPNRQQLERILAKDPVIRNHLFRELNRHGIPFTALTPREMFQHIRIVQAYIANMARMMEKQLNEFDPTDPTNPFNQSNPDNLTNQFFAEQSGINLNQNLLVEMSDETLNNIEFEIEQDEELQHEMEQGQEEDQSDLARTFMFALPAAPVLEKGAEALAPEAENLLQDSLLRVSQQGGPQGLFKNLVNLVENKFEKVDDDMEDFKSAAKVLRPSNKMLEDKQ